MDCIAGAGSCYQREVRPILVFTLAALALCAQPRVNPQFDVATVKPAAPRDRGFGVHGGPGTSDPGHIAYNHEALVTLVVLAYQPKPHQLSTPAWMQNEFFDIEAKVPHGANKDDIPLMLQSLLAERFNLRVHHETKETAAHALTVGADGAKLPAYPLELPPDFNDHQIKFKGVDKDGFPISAPGYTLGMMGSRDGQTRITIARQPIQALCMFLSGVYRSPVVDQTGLTGRYDVRLLFADLARDDDDDAEPAEQKASDPAPPLLHALRKLGLNLERKKMPLDFLVVDHAEKTPTEN